MPQDPRYGFDSQESEEAYRRRQAAKAAKRKRRRTKRALLLGAFALAAVLLIVVLVVIFRGIFGGAPASSSSSVSVSVAPVSVAPVYPHPVAADASVWNLQLVNGQKPIAVDYEMTGEQIAAITQLPNQYWFDSRIVAELEQMIADCNANEGYSLQIRSGYRSPATQNTNYDYLVQLYMGQGLSQVEAEIRANRLEPPSGYSEHQIGLAVDFVTAVVNDTTAAFAETPEYQWLWDNAHNYGFILRYPAEKEAITGFDYQPYHWRYVGVDAAANIKQHQVNAGELICLEEFVMELPAAATSDSTPSAPASLPSSGLSSSVPGSGEEE